MRTVVLMSMVLGFAVISAGCHGKNRTPSDAGARPDAGDAGTDAGDAGVDAGDAGMDAGDAGTQTTSLTGIDPTAGSGEATSASYRLRLNVSSPEPIGTTSSTNYRVSFGPHAPR